MSSLSTLPKGDSAWLLRKSIQRIMQQVSVLETNIGSSTTGNSANTQVIFNDAGTLRGDAGLTYNKTTDTLSTGSATITGDLTVNTSTLKVDSANNRVGLGTASPGYLLDVQAATAVANILSTTGTNTAYLQISNTGGYFYLGRENSAGTTFAAPAYSAVLYAGGAYPLVTTVNGGERYRIASDGVATWSNVGGVAGTAMTLNATGLGVGDTPASNTRLTVAAASRSADTTGQAYIRSTDAQAQDIGAQFTLGGLFNASSHYAFAGIAGRKENGTSGNVAGYLDFLTTTSGGSLTSRMRLDSSGNLGLGVTPSAWNNTYNVLDIGQNGSISGRTSTNNTVDIVSNGFRNSGGTWVYKLAASSAAVRYQIDGSSGAHLWYNAVAGTAGNTIAGFSTPIMTLDASGNLLVGKTATGLTVGVMALATGVVESTMASSTSAQSTLNVYSTGAAAYRFYVGMNGTINATNTTISAISDARLKENVQDIDVGLGAILALKPRKFDWKEGKGKNIKGDRGFIAQEFETVFPNLIDEWKDAAPAGEAPYKSVRQDLIPVLVKAIQELTARVQTLETR